MNIVVLVAAILFAAHNARAQRPPDRFLDCTALPRDIERDACRDPLVMVAVIKKFRAAAETTVKRNTQAYASWGELQKQCGMVAPTNKYKPDVLACLADRVTHDSSSEFRAATAGLEKNMVVAAASSSQHRAVCDRAMNQRDLSRAYWEFNDPPDVMKPDVDWSQSGRFELPLGPKGELRPVIYFPREWRHGAYAWFVVPRAGDGEARQAKGLEGYFWAVRMMTLSYESDILEGFAKASRHPQFGDESWQDNVSGRVKGVTDPGFPALYDPSNTEAFRGGSVYARAFTYAGVPYVRAVSFGRYHEYPEMAVFSFGEAGTLDLACWKIFVHE